MGTHHRLWRWSLSALLSAALLACSGDARKDWMPLQAGHALTYDVRFEGDEPVADTEWTLRRRPTRMERANGVHPLAFGRRALFFGE